MQVERGPCTCVLCTRNKRRQLTRIYGPLPALAGSALIRTRRVSPSRCSITHILARVRIRHTDFMAWLCGCGIQYDIQQHMLQLTAETQADSTGRTTADSSTAYTRGASRRFTVSHRHTTTGRRECARATVNGHSVLLLHAGCAGHTPIYPCGRARSLSVARASRTCGRPFRCRARGQGPAGRAPS